MQELNNDRAINAYRGVAERESDSALWGGFASGLGGIGAGITTAAQMEINNAGVRQRNQMRSDAIFGAAAVQWGSLVQREIREEEEMKRWEKMMQQAQFRRIEHPPKEDLLAILTPRVTSLTVSTTGSILLEVSVRKRTLNIQGSIPAVVDGFITAKLWADGQPAGEIPLTLPLYGISSDRMLKGVLLRREVIAPNYDVTFEATDLWAVEDKDLW